MTAFTEWVSTQGVEGRLIVIENVPAWVCEQCGETFYDPDIVERIQNIVWSDEAPTRTIETPVYDLQRF
ncbi:MAG: type II toxin-antitoxin system MqsA family antitoxin [Anaerolineae bacterium]|nr:type II toxin-antitoxin system MqsA family antitoxin [Anaerolineae bacterium]